MIFTPYGNPLLDASNFDVTAFSYPVWRMDMKHLCVFPLISFTQD